MPIQEKILWHGVNPRWELTGVFGLGKNSRLLQLSQSVQYRASQDYSQKLQTIVEFFETLFAPSSDLKKQATAFVDNSVWYCSLDYKTLETWSRNRRVVAKVEYSNLGVTHRFVVTSLSIRRIHKLSPALFVGAVKPMYTLFVYRAGLNLWRYLWYAPLPYN